MVKESVRICSNIDHYWFDKETWLNPCLLLFVFEWYYVGRDTDYGRVARDFEAMADHTVVQAVYQAASNPGGTISHEVSANTTEMVESSKVNDLKSTPISAVKQSLITAESVQQDIPEASFVEAATTSSSAIAISTPQDSDTKPSATHMEKETDVTVVPS